MGNPDEPWGVRGAGLSEEQQRLRDEDAAHRKALADVAEAPWSVAEWAVAPRFDNPRATVLVLVLG